jgi:hypothetical protein
VESRPLVVLRSNWKQGALLESFIPSSMSIFGRVGRPRWKRSVRRAARAAIGPGVRSESASGLSAMARAPVRCGALRRWGPLRSCARSWCAGIAAVDAAPSWRSRRGVCSRAVTSGQAPSLWRSTGSVSACASPTSAVRSAARARRPRGPRFVAGCVARAGRACGNAFEGARRIGDRVRSRSESR